MAVNIEELLQSRDTSHGDFEQTAKIAQLTKNLWHGEAGWADLDNCQKEALDMIATKIGRILAGDQNFPDHFRDCEGYSKLVADRIEKCIAQNVKAT